MGKETIWDYEDLDARERLMKEKISQLDAGIGGSESKREAASLTKQKRDLQKKLSFVQRIKSKAKPSNIPQAQTGEQLAHAIKSRENVIRGARAFTKLKELGRIENPTPEQQEQMIVLDQLVKNAREQYAEDYKKQESMHQDMLKRTTTTRPTTAGLYDGSAPPPPAPPGKSQMEAPGNVPDVGTEENMLPEDVEPDAFINLGGGHKSTQTSHTTPEVSRKFGLSQQEQVRQNLVYRQEAIKAMQEQNVQAMGKISEMEKSLGIANAEDEYMKAKLQASGDIEELRKWEMDPQRFVKNMGNTQRAMLMLSSALGGFVEGFTGGNVKNRAFGLLDKAIDRDLTAQKSQYAKLLKSANMSVAEKKSALNELNKLNSNKKQLVLKHLALDQAGKALTLQDASAREQAIDAAMRIEKMMTPRKTTTTQKGYSYRKVYNPLHAQHEKRQLLKQNLDERGMQIKPPDPKTTRDFNAGVNTLQNLGRMKTMYKKRTPYQGLRWAGGDTARFIAHRDDVIAQYAKFMTGVAQRKEEYKRLAGTFPQGIGIGEWSKRMGLHKVDLHIAKNIDKLGQMVRSDRSNTLINTVPPKWRKAVMASVKYGATPTKVVESGGKIRAIPIEGKKWRSQ